MGLDITSYSNIAQIDCVFDESGDPIDPVTREMIDYNLHAWVNPDFENRHQPVVNNGVYTCDESFSFSAGSYSGYNTLRNELAKIAGYEPIDDRYDKSAWRCESGPFWEMITFSDCEGIIGSIVAEKLFNDFEKYMTQAESIGGRFFKFYMNFRNAFEMARHNGAVQFH